MSEKMKSFADYAGQGRLEGAFSELGMALHPIMDSTSPAHAGFKKWRYRDSLDHGANLPGAPSLEDVDTAVHYRDQTVKLMPDALHGKLDACGCN